VTLPGAHNRFRFQNYESVGVSKYV